MPKPTRPSPDKLVKYDFLLTEDTFSLETLKEILRSIPGQRWEIYHEEERQYGKLVTCEAPLNDKETEADLKKMLFAAIEKHHDENYGPDEARERWWER